MQRSALCRSRRELSNEYLLAKIGVDTAENEPLEVWGEIIKYYSFVSLYLELRRLLVLIRYLAHQEVRPHGPQVQFRVRRTRGSLALKVNWTFGLLIIDLGYLYAESGQTLQGLF